MRSGVAGFAWRHEQQPGAHVARGALSDPPPAILALALSGAGAETASHGADSLRAKVSCGDARWNPVLDACLAQVVEDDLPPLMELWAGQAPAARKRVLQRFAEAWRLPREEYGARMIGAMAEVACEVNERTENIGARRLATVMERLLEDISFEAPDLSGRTLRVDAALVNERLAALVINEDLSRFIL